MTSSFVDHIPVIVATMLSLGTSARLAFAPVAAAVRKRAVVAVLLLSSLPLIATGIGYALAMSTAFREVATVDPATKAATLSRGISAAMEVPIVGLGALSVTFVAAVGAMLRAPRQGS